MTHNPGEGHHTHGDLFSVGDLRVDVGQQQVTRAGVELALPNLSFQLFLALIRAAPNFLSNDLIMARVWPGLVVSPETVAKRVNLLREALGDDAQEPRYVAGLRSRGYRCVATVSPIAPQGPSAVVPVMEEAQAIFPKATRKRMRSLIYPILFAALIAIFVSARAIKRIHTDNVAPTGDIPLRDGRTTDAPGHTVAVLPFDNLSPDAADAYLAQGFPEMILTRLSRVEGLSIIARTSSFALSVRNIDSHEIGRKLNSSYLVSGSVQRNSDRLRVAVQLVDSATGTMVWSAHFDRSLQDIFSIEDEVADQIAAALSTRLGQREFEPAAGPRSSNLEAYLDYLRGRTLLGRYTAAESEAAAPYFEKTIALDAGFAPAYALLYDARMQAADQRREDMRPVRQRYRHLIDRALQLDRSLGAAYFARAMWADQPYDASAMGNNPLSASREQDFRQGAALDPSNGRGLEAYAEFLRWVMERPEESRNVLKHVLWVDPMSPNARFADAMFGLDDNGVKYSEQRTFQVLELDPNFVPALLLYGKYRWLIDGKLAESVQILEHAIALDPENSVARHGAMTAYLDLGDVAAARNVVAGATRSARAAGLLGMYDGDWRRAGLSAYDEEGWTRDDDHCDMWQSEALRDYALKTGELARAIAFITSKYYFADAPEKNLEVCNTFAAVHLSQLLAAAGQPAKALALRHAASTWNDAHEAKYLGGSRRLRAEILLLDGKKDQALAELAESFRSGFYPRWWYTIDRDPLWLPLHGDARFQAIAVDVRRYVDGQRKQLDALRNRGDVPKRAE